MYIIQLHGRRYLETGYRSSFYATKMMLRLRVGIVKFQWDKNQPSLYQIDWLSSRGREVVKLFRKE